jgi:hypothetical protein
MAMRNAGKPVDEIRLFVWRGVNALALEKRTSMSEVDLEDGWRMQLASTGEVITYGTDGYSYRHRS